MRENLCSPILIETPHGEEPPIGGVSNQAGPPEGGNLEPCTRFPHGEAASYTQPMSAWVYILRCRDGSYYVGSTRGAVENRIAEHNDGTFGGYTSSRRPVALVYAQEFDRITDAITAEQQVKRWSRAKKEALIAGDFDLLRDLAKRRTRHD